MNRLQFIRNVLGATAAVTVGKALAPLATEVIDRPGVSGTSFTLEFQEQWMQQWHKEFEHLIWDGNPTMNK